MSPLSRMFASSSRRLASALSPRRAATTRTPPGARRFLARLFASSSSSSSSDARVDVDAFLEEFTNHERAGVPKGAATAADAGAGDAAFDLGRVRRLLATLGDPQRACPVIHVAGTKGKGSTVAAIAAVLRAAGINTGTYKSPHVHAFSERIVCGNGDDVHGVPGEEEEEEEEKDGGGGGSITIDAATASAIRAARDAERGALTHFEALTAIALKHFADRGADCAVVEVGLGGASDATNVFASDDLAAAAIVAVGGDHVEALGGSARSIVDAKCGIVKAGRPVFIAKQPGGGGVGGEEMDAMLRERVEEAGGDLVSEDVSGSAGGVRVSVAFKRVVEREKARRFEQIVDVTIHSAARSARTLKDVALGTVGPHQRDNLVVATRVLEFLRLGGGGVARRLRRGALAPTPWGAITDDALRLGLSRWRSPGCFEMITPSPPKGAKTCIADDEEGAFYEDLPNPPVVADGAHTPESAAALFATVEEAFPGKAIVAVVAMADDKDHEGFFQEIVRVVDQTKLRAVFLSSVPIAGGGARATATATLRAAWEKNIRPDVAAIAERGVLSEAMDAASDLARECDAVVVVTGSLNVVARARRWGDARR